MLRAGRPEARRTRLPDPFRDRRGATAVEYGLIASLIALALIAALTPLGAAIRNVLLDVASAL